MRKMMVGYKGGDMNHRQFLKFLEDQGACPDALAWIEKEKLSLTQAWKNCTRPQWMEWLSVEDRLRVNGKRLEDGKVILTPYPAFGNSTRNKRNCDKMRKAIGLKVSIARR